MRLTEEDLHPFFGATNSPGPNIDPGPEIAGAAVYPASWKEAPGPRILFLGGSTTANRYPRLVGEHLRRELGSTSIINLSADGTPTLLSLLKFWTYVDLVKPDLIVVLHAINDFYRGFTPPPRVLPQYRNDYSHFVFDRQWQIRPSVYDGRPVFTEGPWRSFTIGSLWQSLTRSSRLLDELRERISAEPSCRETRLPTRQLLRALPDFERNLSNLIDSVKEKAMFLLLLTMPFTLEGNARDFLKPGRYFSNDGIECMPDQQFVEGMQRFNQVTRELAAGSNALFFDLASQLRDATLFEDEVHLTKAGLEIEARLVGDFILSSRVLTKE